jgi:lauroyl/myristoyl acyltransferase
VAAYRAAALAAPALMPAKARRLYRDTRRLFPERSARWAVDIARRQLAHRVWVALDKFSMSRLAPDELLDAAEPEGLDRLRAALRGLAGVGRGAIVYSLHYGRPIIASFLLSRVGFDCIAIRKGVDATVGGASVDAGAVSGLRTALRELRRGKVVFVLVDGRLARSATPVEFFGRTVPMSLAFVRMAQESGAGLVATVASSVGPRRIRLHSEVVPVPAPGEVPSSELLLGPLERAVGYDVGQWYGINRMFRAVEPPGPTGRPPEAR